MKSEKAFFGDDSNDVTLFESIGAILGDIALPPDVNFRTPVTE